VNAAGERLLSLDALRGLAVLGILAVNASVFAAPLYQAWHPSHWPFPANPSSTAIWAVVQVLFTGKFITLFSMLFGASLFLVGGERGDRIRGPALNRRLSWLALFGLVHGLLIWFGDILLTYALAGLVVAQLRSLPARALILLGSVVYTVQAVATGIAEVVWFDRSIETWNLVLPHQAGYLGGFLDSLAANARDWAGVGFLSQFVNTVASAALMLTGLGLYKSGVLKAQSGGGAYLTMIAGGALVILVMAAVVFLEIRSGHDVLAQAWRRSVLHLIAPVITLGYVGAMMMAVQQGAAIARLLAPVGRMAFTNYLVQSLIMTGLFYGGRGPGLFGEVDRPGIALIVLGVWLFQIAVSHLWLGLFAMGPAEWVWRRLTYDRPIPFRRAPG
jgi:uncharacterized protein